MRYDALVIGSGIAGFAAAATLNRRGKRVAVLAHRAGATSVCSGMWDLGPIPAQGQCPLAELTASERWGSIYRRVLYDRQGLVPPCDFPEALEEIAASLSPDLNLQFSFKRPLTLPTTAGKWKLGFAAQALQAKADLPFLKGKRVGLVAAKNWRFPAESLSRRWNESAKARGLETSISPFWLDLELPGGDWPLPHLAARLAADLTLQHRLRDSLIRGLRADWRDFLLFPPLFLDSACAEKMQRELAVPMAESVATVEPVAGERTARAISCALGRLSIPRLTLGEVRCEISEGRARAIFGREQGAAPLQEIEADHFILASGKFFGGGVRMGYRRVDEPVFGLPLFYNRHNGQVKERSQIQWAERPFHEEQAWSGLGVWVNASWRPIDGAFASALENVSACGSILGGVDFAKARLGMGFMAYAGRRCGESAP